MRCVLHADDEVRKQALPCMEQMQANWQFCRQNQLSDTATADGLRLRVRGERRARSGKGSSGRVTGGRCDTHTARSPSPCSAWIFSPFTGNHTVTRRRPQTEDFPRVTTRRLDIVTIAASLVLKKSAPRERVSRIDNLLRAAARNLGEHLNARTPRCRSSTRSTLSFAARHPRAPRASSTGARPTRSGAEGCRPVPAAAARLVAGTAATARRGARLAVAAAASDEPEDWEALFANLKPQALKLLHYKVAILEEAPSRGRQVPIRELSADLDMPREDVLAWLKANKDRQPELAAKYPLKPRARRHRQAQRPPRRSRLRQRSQSKEPTRRRRLRRRRRVRSADILSS